MSARAVDWAVSRGYLALIALCHALLTLADQSISVGHAAVVLHQGLHLMASLALLSSNRTALVLT